MYESPINLYVQETIRKMESEREDAITAKISESIGIDINKDELIKALQYDRQQYHKGYADAKAMRESMLYEIRTGIEQKCDRINSLSSVLPYAAHREIQELLCEIMELFEPQESEDKNE